jgi:hypothetical protein
VPKPGNLDLSAKCITSEEVGWLGVSFVTQTVSVNNSIGCVYKEADAVGVVSGVVSVSVTCRASRDRINSKTKFRIRWLVNADALWRKMTTFELLSLWSEENETNRDCICLAFLFSNVVYSKIQFILQNSRLLTWKKLLQPCLCDNCTIYFLTTQTAACYRMKYYGFKFSDAAGCLAMTFANVFWCCNK